MDNLDASMPREFSQTINFIGSDVNYSAGIAAGEVVVNCSPGTHNHGSSRVKLINVVDFNWEHKYYHGNIIAAHRSGALVAYAIKSKGGGMVRVLNRITGSRSLLVDMTSPIQDLAFAHIPDEVLLACIDETGKLYVYKIEQQLEYFNMSLLLCVTPDSVFGSSVHHRVGWCPFLPEEDNNSDPWEDFSKLLVITHGNKAEVWMLPLVKSHHPSGNVTPSQVDEGCLEINEHTQAIVEVAFSPDGTALATASIDGFVKFFSVYLQGDRKPKCLHEWQPHGGKALSCLYFLDNLRNSRPEGQFWKFAITGCSHNSELKVWSCESWSCLQKITFNPSPSAAFSELLLKPCFDLTADYLILSDIHNRLLYVLQLESGRDSSHVGRISEHLLPSSFLSFAIVEAGVDKVRSSFDDALPADEDVEDEFDDQEQRPKSSVVVCMFVVQAKRLQECHVAFDKEPAGGAVIVTSSPKALLSPKDKEGEEEDDDEEEEEDDEEEEDVGGGCEEEDEKEEKEARREQQAESGTPNGSSATDQHFADFQNLLAQQSLPLNLMTPDAFNSPGQHDTASPDRRRSVDKSAVAVEELNSPISGEKENLFGTVDEDENLIGFERSVNKENFASGGSSPSREVQEILSLNNSGFDEQSDFFKVDENGVKPANTSSPKEEEEDYAVEMGANKEGEDDEETQVPFQQHNSSPTWASIPMIKANNIRKSEETRMVLEEMKEIIQGENEANLQFKLLSLVHEQSKQLQQLQAQVKALTIRSETLQADLSSVMAKTLDVALARSADQQYKVLQSWAHNRARKETEFLQSLTAAVKKSVSKDMHSAFVHEMKQIILPQISTTLEDVKSKLGSYICLSFANSDEMLKKHMLKYFSSQQISDTVAAGVIAKLKPEMERSYREAIISNLVPSFEQVCNNMFQQMRTIFTQGTKEYITSVEAHFEKQKQVQERNKEVQNQMLIETINVNSDNAVATLSAGMQHSMKKSMLNLQDNMVGKIVESFKEQIAVAFRAHATIIEDNVLNVVRSRAVTPAPHLVDTQVQMAQIQQLLRQGQINTAFQQALSAADLSLVVFICETVDPHQVFGSTPGLLQEHVLLSLVQQLGADMSTHTEVKLKYLEEAILNLDPSNIVSKEHLPKVMIELDRSLSAYIASSPSKKNTKRLKMLQMGVQLLLKS